MIKVFENQFIKFQADGLTCVGRTYQKDEVWYVACLDTDGNLFILSFDDVHEPSLMKV